MLSGNIPEASEIQTPLYSGHAVVVLMVSALEGFHCIGFKASLPYASHEHDIVSHSDEHGHISFSTQNYPSVKCMQSFSPQMCIALKV